MDKELLLAKIKLVNSVHQDANSICPQISNILQNFQNSKVITKNLQFTPKLNQNLQSLFNQYKSQILNHSSHSSISFSIQSSVSHNQKTYYHQTLIIVANLQNQQISQILTHQPLKCNYNLQNVQTLIQQFENAKTLLQQTKNNLRHFTEFTKI